MRETHVKGIAEWNQVWQQIAFVGGRGKVLKLDA